MRTYITTQDDTWDLIAIKVYGAKRGNEHWMYRLLEENYPLVNVLIFTAGVLVNVPDIDVTVDVPLVPWKNATVLTN